MGKFTVRDLENLKQELQNDKVHHCFLVPNKVFFKIKKEFKGIDNVFIRNGGNIKEVAYFRGGEN